MTKPKFSRALKRVASDVLEAAHIKWQSHLKYPDLNGSLYVCDCVRASAASLCDKNFHPEGIHEEAYLAVTEVVGKKINKCFGVPEFLGIKTGSHEGDQRHPDVIAFRQALWAELKEMFK